MWSYNYFPVNRAQVLYCPFYKRLDSSMVAIMLSPHISVGGSSSRFSVSCSTRHLPTNLTCNPLDTSLPLLSNGRSFILTYSRAKKKPSCTRPIRIISSSSVTDRRSQRFRSDCTHELRRNTDQLQRLIYGLLYAGPSSVRFPSPSRLSPRVDNAPD